MVVFTATPSMLTAIASLPQTSLLTLSNSDLDTLPETPGAPISHATLIHLSRLLKSSSSAQKSTLNDLLRSSHPYTPPPPPPPIKTPEYEALMVRLRAEQERREYIALTAQSSNKASFGTIQDALENDGEKDDITPSLVFNILLSIVMCGVATWHITRYWRNDGVRVLVSLLVAVVVGVAEVVVYSGYLRKVRESQEKERRIRERKEVVESEVLGGKTGGETAEDKESQEIWGKGKHGGMRRRVREQWEKEKEDQEADGQS